MAGGASGPGCKAGNSTWFAGMGVSNAAQEKFPGEQGYNSFVIAIKIIVVAIIVFVVAVHYDNSRISFRWSSIRLCGVCD